MAGTFSFGQWRTRVTAGIGGTVAILASWTMGLFAVKDAPAPPALAAGRPIAAGEWTLRLDRAALSDSLPDGRSIAGSGRKAIVLYLQATNRTARTSSSFVQAVAPETPVRGLDAKPTPYFLRDRTVMAALQPALPEEMALVWTYPTATPTPTRLRFAVSASTYKQFDNLYAQPGWYDPHAVGVVDVPVAAGAAS